MLTTLTKSRTIDQTKFTNSHIYKTTKDPELPTTTYTHSWSSQHPNNQISPILLPKKIPKMEENIISICLLTILTKCRTVDHNKLKNTHIYKPTKGPNFQIKTLTNSCSSQNPYIKKKTQRSKTLRQCKCRTITAIRPMNSLNQTSKCI